MPRYKVVEIFESINGESKRAGQLALFVRFKGCNLDCSYCDTKWANSSDTKYTLLSEDEIYNIALESKIKNITLTGGEPLLQDNIGVLLEKLLFDGNFNVEIETNGSVSLEEFRKNFNTLSFTMDYKLPASNMELQMNLDNFRYISYNDTVKFVTSNITDLESSREIMEKYHLIGRCAIYLSPVYGEINLQDMVEFMKKHKMNGVNLQLQLHKIIWDPNAKGV